MDHPVLYQHSQSWPPAFAILLCCWWIPVVLGPARDDIGRVLPVLGLLLVVTMLYVGFLRLSVTVTHAEVHLAYTLGRPRRRIDRGRIISAVPHRIPWWYGFGIRRTPKGWMWNVWGRNTVLITLTDSQFLIGTDDPEGLSAALAPL